MLPFDLFTRRKRATPVRRVRLSLEALDARLAPSGTNDDPDYIPVPDAPPRIVDFAAVEYSHGLFTFSGRVIDESPGGLTVKFGGSPVTTFGMTITTESDGVFSKTVQMLTNGQDSGTITAQTRDAGGQASNVASKDIDPTP